jgi:DNA polymerase-3 subunit beta
MDIELGGSALYAALRAVAPAASNDFGVHLNAEGDVLHITAFSRELAMEVRVPATVNTAGDVVVYHSPLASRVGELTGESIRITSSDDSLSLVGGSAKFRLGTLAASDFPKVTPPAGDGMEITTDEFLQAVRQVLPAASSDQQRPLLTGVLLNPEKERLVLVTTDSYRLAVKTIPTTAALTQRAVVPASVLKVLARVGNVDTLVVKLDDKKIAFSDENFSITTSLLDSQYPNYTSLLAPSYKTRWTVSREALLAMLSRAKVALDGSSAGVSIEVRADGTAVASLPDGNFEEVVTGSLAGSPLTFGVNPAFLTAGVDVCADGTVVLAANDPVKPIGVTGENDDSFIYVVMPIRL